MSALQPISPKYNSGQTVSVSSTAGVVTIEKNNFNIVVTNLGAKTAYVRVMEDTSTNASTADFPILPNTQVALTKVDKTKVGYICGGSDTTSLHIITGEGWL